MSIFSEATWEPNEIGDSLNKELFRKKIKIKNKKLRKSKISKGSQNLQVKEHDITCDSMQSIEHVDVNKQKKKKKRKKDRNGDRSTFNSVQTIESVKINDQGKKKKRKLSKSNAEEVPSKIIKSNAVSQVDQESKNYVHKNELSDVVNDKIIKKKEKKKKHSDMQCENIQECNPTASMVKEKSLNKKKVKKTETVYEKEIPSRSNFVKKGKVDGYKTNLNIEKLRKLLEEKEQSEVKVKKAIMKPLSLRDRMMAQLKASRFRFLNEKLYNNESKQSKEYFKSNPEEFLAYHEGYRHQVEQWPINPLDIIISAIKKMPSDHVIADFGCGEAKLADSVPHKVHSLDLVSVNDKVKACDMAHTPLLTNGVNVVVFCLSLMGTNLSDYLLEANRVLKKDGILKIAEVESRFDNVEHFTKELSNYGFIDTWQDLSHDLFYFMDFKKTRGKN
ncbi:ribosomal RNA-processing protein 8 isoform X2 [Orussus abietinus]|uniref:ribosomal RNA-processing protein 8 isoform X2 n=1 Tax=Orussus abietinus TaxID=222816 RepID=UPI0006257BCA|nr:ribosomal RNA-processing protein 8 isoform X2 [Orussus abietinus]